MLAKQFFRALARQLPGTGTLSELEKEEKGSTDSSESI
jgi:hypothetical protein